MAPTTWLPLSLLAARAADAAGAAGGSDSLETVSDYLAAQWLNPGDILSVLLLLGPDIIQRAVAQLAGRAITPVAFSFGWVASSASALLATFGGN